MVNKVAESMFKPLFVNSIEWAESVVDETASAGSIDRAIYFYGMVNKLAENHRSLFVPYFKYLLGSCVHHLGDDGDSNVSSLGLRIIKHFVDNLEEEYLVLLAETILCLCELLEDVEL